MTQRGLLPDFSPAALQEAGAMTGAAGETGGAVRDLARPALGLDRQRRLARPRSALGGGAGRGRRGPDPGRGRRRRRPGPRRIGARRPRPGQHHLGLHRRPDLPHAAGEALDRPHLARRGPGPPGHRHRPRRSAPTAWCGAPRSTAPWSGTAPSWPTTPWPPGWTAPAPAPPRVAAVPGLEQQLRTQDRVAQAMKALRHQHGALTPGEHRGPRRLRRRRAHRPPARPEEQGQGADRELHDRRQRRHRAVPRAARASRRCAGCCACPSAGTGSSPWPLAWGSTCRRSRAPPRSRPSWPRAARPIRRGSPISPSP